MKKFFSLKKIYVFVVLFFFLAVSLGVLSANATDLSSTNFIIKDPIIGTGGGYGTSGSFGLTSSGNTLLSGRASSASFKAKYGFLYFPSASTPQSITFDIDTAPDFSNDESGTPYTVALGTLSSSSVKHSDSSTVRMIVLEGESSHGIVVTVNNTNGTNGLVSASVPADNINSAAGTMAAGTENYGLCVATSGLTGFSRSSPYDSGSCALASGTNAVKALSSTPASIVDSGGLALTGGHAEVVVNGAISTVIPAHTDYADTLTFIATSTY
jgi:hypothetical protein